MSIKIDNSQIKVLNPANLQEVGMVEISTPKEIDNTITNARDCKQWSSLSLNKRCRLINKFRKVVLKNSELVKQKIKDETGKKDFVIWVELFSFLDHAKTMSKIAKNCLKRDYRNTGLLFKNKTAYVQYEPLGTIGIISPWNYPLSTPMNSSVEALLAGNNVILKPSEHTPLTTNFLKKLWDENIGYKNAFQILNGQGDVGAILVASDFIDIISFTGSTEVGKQIAKVCSKTLKPCILELGGKDPMIILKDACLNRAVESALYAGLFNSGQTCISTEEVYVEEQIFDKFLLMLSNRIKTFNSGEKVNDHLGPIITLETKEKIENQINEIKDVCKIITGSNDDENIYIAPTIVVDPPESSQIVNEETFGPVMSIRRFENENELIEKIHKTGYGLSSSIFGKNKERINRIIKNIKTGSVNINDVMTNYAIPSLPYGGEGISGLGKQHGVEGLRSLSRTKSIVVNKFNFINELTWWNRPKIIERILEKLTYLLFKLYI